MTRDEATTILAGLTAAFPSARLEDDTPDVWRKHLAPLDFDVADRAVGQCVANLKFFPSVAEFREFYRLERHNSPRKWTPEPEGSSDIPEWVQVWHWHRLRTMGERQAANTEYAHMKIAERPPMRLRLFPQEAEKGPDAYTLEEYERIRQAWIKAGSPEFGGISELVGELVGATA